MQDVAMSPVLIVENSHTEYESILEALRAEGVEHRAYRIVVGPDCLDYLHRRMGHQKHKGEPLPCLILMDLTLPGVDAWQLIEEIKATPAFRRIPLIVMADGPDDAYVRLCYSYGAEGVLTKSVSREVFVDDLRKVIHYWTKVVTMPERRPVA